jgi:hypothetical protein
LENVILVLTALLTGFSFLTSEELKEAARTEELNDLARQGKVMETQSKLLDIISAAVGGGILRKWSTAALKRIQAL